MAAHRARSGGRWRLGLLLCVLGAGASADAQTAEEENTIRVFERARWGVVHIKTLRRASEPFGETTYAEGVGSGFVVDGEGHILTNYHVVAESNRIEVYLPRGRMTVARLVGTAPTLDLALLGVSLTAEDGVEPLELGESESVRVGQKVIVVGHPLALHDTVTVGILSAVRRSIPDTALELQGELLQVDAAVNPGNSGGPVLDSGGRVIGVVAALARESQSVGFAVPIDLAKEVLPELIRMGHPYRPAIGIDGVAITPELADLFGLPLRSGFLVERVVPGSLAERVGMRTGDRLVLWNEMAYVLGGDIVTAIDDESVSSAADIARVLLKARPGQELRLTIFRDGQSEELSLRLRPMHGR